MFTHPRPERTEVILTATLAGNNMKRILDELSENIWRSIAWDTEMNAGSKTHWEEEWELQWTSSWNYDDIYMWYDTKWDMWVWTDGIKGATLV